MDNQKDRSLLILIGVFIILTTCLGGYIVYDKLNSSTDNIDTPINNVDQVEGENNANKVEDDDKNEENNNSSVVSVNKRLYSVDSEMNKQRYYLLLDDATYDMNQNFLNKKTYILDLNMISGNEIVKEVDLASVFAPIANQYISTHRGNHAGDCTVEYFGVKGLTPPPIDYEKEVAFKGYYRCVNNHVETSLGSVIYAYNVETNSIRELGTSN